MPRTPTIIRIQPTTSRFTPETLTFRAKVRIAPSASRTIEVPSRMRTPLSRIGAETAGRTGGGCRGRLTARVATARTADQRRVPRKGGVLRGSKAGPAAELGDRPMPGPPPQHDRCPRPTWDHDEEEPSDAFLPPDDAA